MITEPTRASRFALDLEAQSLIASAFLFAFASYMVTPFLAIFFETNLGMQESLIGFFVGAMTLIQFGCGIVGGILAERLGLKTAMLFALYARVVGFVLMAASISHHWLFVPAGILIAISPAVYLPTNRAYLVKITETSHTRSWILSLANSALNAGMSLGPLLAAAYFEKNAALVLYSAAVLFLLLSALHFRLPDIPADSKPLLRGDIFAAAWAIKKPLLFSVLTYYTYFHFQSFMGLYMKTMFSTSLFSWLLFMNFAILIVLQPLCSTKIASANYHSLLITGFLFFAIGFFLISGASLFLTVLGTAVMSLGQVLLFLRSDLEILKSPKLSAAVAFGLQRLTVGVGGAVGSTVAGWTFQYCKIHGHLSAFWSGAALQAVLVMMATVIYRARSK